MASYNLIPLQSIPQTLTIALGATTYQLTLKYWNNPMAGWTLDIADSNNNPILQGIPLVTGTDLLAQYDYLDLGGSLYVTTTSDPDAVPTFDNLGTDANLYFAVP